MNCDGIIRTRLCHILSECERTKCQNTTTASTVVDTTSSLVWGKHLCKHYTGPGMDQLLPAEVLIIILESTIDSVGYYGLITSCMGFAVFSRELMASSKRKFAFERPYLPDCSTIHCRHGEDDRCRTEGTETVLPNGVRHGTMHKTRRGKLSTIQYRDGRKHGVEEIERRGTDAWTQKHWVDGECIRVAQGKEDEIVHTTVYSSNQSEHSYRHSAVKASTYHEGETETVFEMRQNPPSIRRKKIYKSGLLPGMHKRSYHELKGLVPAQPIQLLKEIKFTKTGSRRRVRLYNTERMTLIRQQVYKDKDELWDEFGDQLEEQRQRDSLHDTELMHELYELAASLEVM